MHHSDLDEAKPGDWVGVHVRATRGNEREITRGMVAVPEGEVARDDKSGRAAQVDTFTAQVGG